MRSRREWASCRERAAPPLHTAPTSALLDTPGQQDHGPTAGGATGPVPKSRVGPHEVIPVHKGHLFLSGGCRAHSVGSPAQRRTRPNQPNTVGIPSGTRVALVGRCTPSHGRSGPGCSDARSGPLGAARRAGPPTEPPPRSRSRCPRSLARHCSSPSPSRSAAAASGRGVAHPRVGQPPTVLDQGGATCAARVLLARGARQAPAAVPAALGH